MRCLLFLFPVVVIGTTVFAEDSEELTFEKHIRPIFRAHCFDCHGATEELEGGLDLRLVRFLVKGGDSGSALVPGDALQSYLLDRIRSGEMPPGDKKVTPAELEILERWVASGAKTARPEPESIGPGLGVTAEERAFWSFQPIQRPSIPDVSALAAGHQAVTAIDKFLLKEAPEARFADEADRRTLIIRAYFDLTGLPPTTEKLQGWLADSGEDWFARLLTELLDSPHYGEHWGRHWLDVAGYADSEGFTVADAERPWAWKYRDWVIRALNQDKPFDQFITEQLAGDELAGPQNGDLTDEQIDLLTATGYLRMAADGTGSGANTPEGRNQVMIDTLKIVGTSLLGLSVQCAQCHDHRYDPIPQSDYYALRAVFEPALDWQAWQTPQQRRISLYTAADRERAAEVEAEAQQVAAEKSTKQNEYLAQALEQELMKFEEPLRTELRAAKETADKDRTEVQKQLLKSHPSVNISPGVLYQYLPQAAEELKKFDQRIAEIRTRKPPEAFLRVLQERPNHLPETKLFHRGDHQQPKETVTPAALTVTAAPGERVEFPINDESLPTSGRRLAFARWLTSRGNPLFARVIVNRVWMHHFGQGLVATPADFGKLGVEPSHPELLDWLADEFMQQGWSLKHLHRLIMTSAAWRQSKEFSSEQSLASVEADLAFQSPILRLSAETIRDRMLAATGQLDPTLFGPPVGIQEDETGQVIVAGEQKRRSLYVRSQRSRPVAMLQAFDAPVMETNCEVRANSTVATQSLMLLNGEFILQQAARLAERAAREAISLKPDQLDGLPQIAQPAGALWEYGFGYFDEGANRTHVFTPLQHWDGSRWQGGEQLPDPQVGWVFLTNTGGHPDIPERGVIRRWTAPVSGVISISGKLSHGSASGDGVRGRIVTSVQGQLAEWTAHNTALETPVMNVQVQANESIDFITDCITNQNSDSFSWPVTISLHSAATAGGDAMVEVFSSADQFRGPQESVAAIPGQIVRVWQLAFNREPTDQELRLAIDFVSLQIKTFQTHSAGIPAGGTAIRQAMTNLSQALLSSNEFLYIE